MNKATTAKKSSIQKKPVAEWMPNPQADLIYRRLGKCYPDAHCELIYDTPFQLAVAAILSAQCTDKRVNLVTPALFKEYATVEQFAQADIKKLEKLIHSTGFFRNKAKNIIALAQTVLRKHNGELPDVLEDLVKLPGIGRKTANVLLISAFNKPGITVDTHCKRVANRLNLTKNSNPDKIEQDLKLIFSPNKWANLSHRMVFHGRYRCHSRTPDCPNCNLTDLCPSASV